MARLIESDPVPLKVDREGVLRVGDTRVTLDSLVVVFEDGASAEEITSRFPSLRLSDVYTVIGYYLKHKDTLAAYLQKRSEEAEQLRQQIESRWPSAGVRERLLQRRAERLNKTPGS